jgi:trans-aconitate 2-methyltransferase
MAFKFNGEKYKKASFHQKTWGKKLISELHLKGNEKILDLGCGDGILTASLAELVPTGFVIGVDSSKSMIDFSQKNSQSINIRFDLLDINEINYKQEFDVVFSNATLHWIHDHKKLLSNVYRSLREHGILRFNFAADGNCSNLIRILRNLIAKERYAVYFHEFNWPWYMPKIKDYKSLIEKMPFKEKIVWEENADRYFPNEEEMVKWIEQPSIVPFLQQLPEKNKISFRDDVVEQMIKDTKEKDGRFFETFRRINIYANK